MPALPSLPEVSVRDLAKQGSNRRTQLKCAGSFTFFPRTTPSRCVGCVATFSERVAETWFRGHVTPPP